MGYRAKENPMQRLFCFPHAGGGSIGFNRWRRRFPGRIEVCPVQLPGRENRIREPGYGNLADLARVLASVIRAHSDRPFSLFGHSLGALICFELARELRRQKGAGPDWLFVSGCCAPHRIPVRERKLHLLPDTKLWQEVAELNGIPEPLIKHEEFKALLLPVLRSDFKMVETWRYAWEPPLECPIAVLGGLQDPGITKEDLDAWREHSRKGSRSYWFPGDHFYLKDQEDKLLPLLSEIMREGRHGAETESER